MIQYVKTAKVNLQDENVPAKTYAQAQSRATMDIEGLASHMASHNSPFTKGTISAVITDMVSCIREVLLDGYRVHLGQLGNFYVSLKSTGVCESVVDEDTGEKPVFTAENITAVNTIYRMGSGFVDMINDAEFEETVSHKEKAAAIASKNTKLETGTYINKG